MEDMRIKKLVMKFLDSQYEDDRLEALETLHSISVSAPVDVGVHMIENMKLIYPLEIPILINLFLAKKEFIEIYLKANNNDISRIIENKRLRDMEILVLMILSKCPCCKSRICPHRIRLVKSQENIVVFLIKLLKIGLSRLAYFLIKDDNYIKTSIGVSDYFDYCLGDMSVDKFCSLENFKDLVGFRSVTAEISAENKMPKDVIDVYVNLFELSIYEYCTRKNHIRNVCNEYIEIIQYIDYYIKESGTYDDAADDVIGALLLNNVLNQRIYMELKNKIFKIELLDEKNNISLLQEKVSRFYKVIFKNKKYKLLLKVVMNNKTISELIFSSNEFKEMLYDLKYKLVNNFDESENCFVGNREYENGVLELLYEYSRENTLCFPNFITSSFSNYLQLDLERNIPCLVYSVINFTRIEDLNFFKRIVYDSSNSDIFIGLSLLFLLLKKVDVCLNLKSQIFYLRCIFSLNEICEIPQKIRDEILWSSICALRYLDGGDMRIDSRYIKEIEQKSEEATHDCSDKLEDAELCQESPILVQQVIEELSRVTVNEKNTDGQKKISNIFGYKKIFSKLTGSASETEQDL